MIVSIEVGIAEMYAQSEAETKQLHVLAMAVRTKGIAWVADVIAQAAKEME